MTLETMVKKVYFRTTIIGDINAKSSNFYIHDERGFEGSITKNATSQFGLYQLINEPTHLLQNASSSWT